MLGDPQFTAEIAEPATSTRHSPGGYIVPQGVRRYAFGDLGHVGRGVAGPRELARRHRVGRVLAGEQPALRLRNTIPVAQKREQHRGKHRVAILAALGGEKEYYDRATDPDELHNTYASLPDDQKASLHAMLTGLQNCHDAQSCAAVDGSNRSAARK